MYTDTLSSQVSPQFQGESLRLSLTFLMVSICQEPIIHGNLTCDTIFIQHNGLVKIGSVAPDAIHKNVKTFRENIKNFHFLAPEWAGRTKPWGAA